jgi:cation/acetate symporter
MPIWVVGLVGAGGFAAALSTADGLLLAIANALSHDVYYKMIDPKADTKRASWSRRSCWWSWRSRRRSWRGPSRRTSCRWWPGPSRSPRPGSSRRWCWGSGGSARPTGRDLRHDRGLRRDDGLPARQRLRLRSAQPRGEIAWFGVKAISSGIFGVPVAFIVTYVVSLMTPEPSQEMQDFVDRLRLPKGGNMMVQTH